MAEFDQAFLEQMLERWTETIQVELNNQTQGLSGERGASLSTLYTELRGLRNEIENQTDSLESALEKLVDGFQKSQRAASEESGSEPNQDSTTDYSSNPNVFDTLSQADQKLQNSLKGLTDRIEQTQSNFVSLFKAVGLSTTYFTIFSSTLDTTYTSLRNLSSVGQTFTGGLEGLFHLAEDAQMGLQDFSETVKTASVAVSQLGLQGFADLQAEVRKSLRPMGMLGLEAQEVANYLNEYVDIQRRAGLVSELSQQEMRRKSTEFIQQVTALSDATGKARETILQEVSSALRDPDVAAIRQRLDEDVRGEFERISAIVSQTDSLSSGFQDMVNKIMTGLPAGASDFAQKMFKAGGNEFISSISEVLRRVRNGTAGEEEFYRTLMEQRERMKDETRLMTDQFQVWRQLRAELGGLEEDYLQSLKDQERPEPMIEALMTTSERVKEMFGALAGLGGDVIKAFDDQILTVLETTSGALKTFTEWIKTASDHIKDAVESLGETGKWIALLSSGMLALAPVFKTITSIGKKVAHVFSRIVQTGAEYAGSRGGRGRGRLGRAFGFLTGGAARLGLAGLVGQGFNTAEGAAEENDREGLGKLAGIGEYASYGAGIGSFGGLPGMALGGLAGGFVGLINEFIEDIFNTSIIEALKNGLSSLSDWVENNFSISNFVSKVADTYNNVMNWLADKVAGIFIFIEDLITESYPTVKNAFSSVISFFENGFNSLYNWVRRIDVTGVFTSIIDFFEDGFNSLYDWMGNISVSDITSSIKDMYNNLMDWISDKISDIFLAIKNAAIEKYEDIKDTFSNLFGGDDEEVKPSKSGSAGRFGGAASDVQRTQEGNIRELNKTEIKNVAEMNMRTNLKSQLEEMKNVSQREVTQLMEYLKNKDEDFINVMSQQNEKSDAIIEVLQNSEQISKQQKQRLDEILSENERTRKNTEKSPSSPIGSNWGRQ